MLKLFSGIVCIAGAIMLFLRSLFMEYPMGYRVLAVALAILGLYLAFTCARPSKRQRQAAEARRSQQTQAAAKASAVAPKTKTISFRLAGVTYKNDDGSDRQAILRHLHFGDEPYANAQGVLFPEIKETEFDGELALACYINDYQVGFVPKSKIDAVQDALDTLTADIMDPEIIGGGYTDEGEKINYGCKFTVEYTPN